MIDENYSSFTKTGPNEGNYKPDEPANHSKERKEDKGARAREKKDYQQSLVFIVWTLEIVFKRQKNQCRRSLKDPFLERPGFHKSRYIYICQPDLIISRLPVGN